MKSVFRSLQARTTRAAIRVAAAPLHFKHTLASWRIPITHNERKLLALRDRYSGRRCVVIGGGPSLKCMNLNALAGEITFCVNGFYHLFESLRFVPTFYVVEDRLVAEDNRHEINALVGVTKIFPEDLRYCLKPSEETIFLRFDRFYDDPDAPGPDFPRFVDPSRLLFYWGGTVSYLCLELAFYMGFREVYVIGMDMSYAVPPTGSHRGVITSVQHDANHVHPSWFGPGKRWHDPQVERMNRAFVRARTAFEAKGGRLFNATAGGNLRAYERVDFDHIFR
jgi:hypothetical protein